MNDRAPSPVRLRVLAGSLAAVGGAIVFRASLTSRDLTAYVPVVAIVIGALVVHSRSLAGQLLGRALLWSNFILGALLCMLGSHSERVSCLGLLLGCGLGLLLAERRALTAAADARGFRPAAFAGTIELLMVLALADAQTCALLGFVGDGAASHAYFVAAIALVVGFIGLYRLALWGVVITMSTAAALSLSMLLNVVGVKELSVPFALVFGLQVVAPLPMLYALLTRRSLPQLNARFRSAAASLVVVVVLVVSAVASLTGPWLHP